MPDAIFEDPRLAQVYDPPDRDRSDLDAYVAIVEEVDATSLLDVGCGTGTLACLLAGRGVAVVAVDPALASLDVARRKLTPTGGSGSTVTLRRCRRSRSMLPS